MTMAKPVLPLQPSRGFHGFVRSGRVFDGGGILSESRFFGIYFQLSGNFSRLGMSIAVFGL